MASMSPTAARHPTLLPALRRLWRDSNRLQLGTDPERAIVLELADPAMARLLDLLDGTRTEKALLREAGRYGIAAEDANALLAALRRAGLVLDARALIPTGLAGLALRRLSGEATAAALRRTQDGPRPAAVLRRRRNAQVIITGASQLAVPIGCNLASSGVIRLDPDVNGVVRIEDATPGGLLPIDVHRPRAVAAAEAIRRAAPEAQLGPLRRDQATFAVLVGYAAPAALTALSFGTRRLCHLSVTIRDGTVVIGPLVRPGLTPCLNCLDLHRRDRDPLWPRLAAQLHTAPETAEPVAAATAAFGAAYAAGEILTHIDGGSPATLGATIEIAGPGEHRRRRWSAHPACGCLRRVRSRRR